MFTSGYLRTSNGLGSAQHSFSEARNNANGATFGAVFHIKPGVCFSSGASADVNSSPTSFFRDLFSTTVFVVACLLNRVPDDTGLSIKRILEFISSESNVTFWNSL